MFASLKNKIGKEIGNDVTAVVRHAGSVRGINSRHVSQVDNILFITYSNYLLIYLLNLFRPGHQAA